EVARLVREAEQTAVTLIRTHQRDLDRLSDLLVEKETVDGGEVYQLLGLAVPEHQPEGQAIAPGRAAASVAPAAGAHTGAHGAGTHGASTHGASTHGASTHVAETHSASATPNSSRAAIPPDQPPPDELG
ncbi:MAG TPA: hypothetical protein VHT94_17475, partial [Streptosporangiaceae bacterium]|nr:hypothetical protein [Streptosporangiaceae bacterium]